MNAHATPYVLRCGAGEQTSYTHQTSLHIKVPIADHDLLLPLFDSQNCQHKFDELATDPRFRFFGNVCIGNSTSPLPGGPSYTYPDALHLPLTSLYPYYNTLLFSYGSSHSTPLPNTPGSSASSDRLENVFPALAFVNWYNGHPAYTHLAPDLSGETVTVVGHGNVAVDCARILLKPPSEFVGTDMPTPIIEHLKKSRVKRVEVVGRRGPAQVAFTTKEFREMVNLEGIRYQPVKGEMMDQAKEMVKGDRARTRLLDLMAKGGKVKSSSTSTTTTTMSEEKEFQLGFLRSPKAFLSDPTRPGKVGSVRWARNALLAQPSVPQGPAPDPPAAPPSERPASSSVLARPTGEEYAAPTGMIIESVGYRGEPIWEGEAGQGETGGVPFDRARARVMNLEGRVTDGSGVMVSRTLVDLARGRRTNRVIIGHSQIPGMYTAGWIASGPIGVIASTMQRAYAVASTILTDHYQSAPLGASSILCPEPQLGGTPDFITSSTRRVVDLNDWKRIDEAEVERGVAQGKPREKFVSIREMLKVLD